MAYSQNAPQWSDTILGFDDSDPNSPNYGTIGKYGCYITAIANVCQWAGNDQNPAQVDAYCQQNNLFVSGDLLSRNDVPAMICSNLQFVGFTTWSSATPMEFFSDASDPNVAYIIRIQTPTVPTHFSMVWSTTGNGDLIIDDSWDGVRKNLSHYGDPATILTSASKFIKIVPPAPVEAPAPVVEAPVVPEPVPVATPVVETPVTAPKMVTVVTTPPVQTSTTTVTLNPLFAYKPSKANWFTTLLQWLYKILIGDKNVF
jgi:hypothetical protein